MTIHLWIDPYGYDAFGNVVERGSRATAVLTIRNDDPDLSAPPMYEKYTPVPTQPAPPPYVSSTRSPYVCSPSC